MATIEVTPTLIGAMLTALGSLLVATWALSRRSKGWDEAERLRLIIDGDPDNGKKGLRRQLEDLLTQTIPQLEDAVVSLTHVVSWVRKGLNAHGSDEHTVSEAVRKSIADIAIERAKHLDVQRARRALIRENDLRMQRGEAPQSSLFDERNGDEDDDDSLALPNVAVPQAPQHPANPDLGRRLPSRGMRTFVPGLPREEPEPPWNPDDTANGRRRGDRRG